MIAQTPKVVREIGGRSVALLTIFLQTTLHDPTEWLSERWRLIVEDRGKGIHRRGAAERILSRRHLVENQAEGKLIGVEINIVSARLLGRHVTRRAENEAGARYLRSCRRTRLLRNGRILDQAEIENLRRAVAGDHHVFGFEISVN